MAAPAGKVLELVVFELNEGVSREQFLATNDAVSAWISKQPGFISDELSHDSEAFELRGDLRLLMRLQRDARGLLPVAQRRIEDGDPACCHCSSF